MKVPELDDAWWMVDAACAEVPNAGRLFFPESGKPAARAKQICHDCPVIEECLAFAFANKIDHGVWGGMTDRERRRAKKRRTLYSL